MLKTILVTFLLLTTTLLANDARLNNYAQTKEWLKDANTNADSAYNIGHTYQTKIKDYDKAVYWYKKAYSLDKGRDVSNNIGSVYKSIKNYDEAIKWYKIGIKQGNKKSSFNLALLYEDKLKDNPNAIKYYKKAISLGHKGAAFNLAILYKENLKDYPNAIKYYTKAYEMGEMGGALNLAHLYEGILKQPKKAMIWYKKAAKGGYANAIKDLAHIAHEKNNNIEGGAYFIALINVKYSKQKVIKFLKTKWKLTDTELQKAYELQLKLDIPKHYRGGI